MENEFKCPRCGRHDRLMVVVTADAAIGYDPADGGLGCFDVRQETACHDEHSPMRCTSCDHRAEACDFINPDFSYDQSKEVDVVVAIRLPINTCQYHHEPAETVADALLEIGEWAQAHGELRIGSSHKIDVAELTGVEIVVDHAIPVPKRDFVGDSAAILAQHKAVDRDCADLGSAEMGFTAEQLSLAVLISYNYASATLADHVHQIAQGETYNAFVLRLVGDLPIANERDREAINHYIMGHDASLSDRLQLQDLGNRIRALDQKAQSPSNQIGALGNSDEPEKNELPEWVSYRKWFGRHMTHSDALENIKQYPEHREGEHYRITEDGKLEVVVHRMREVLDANT